MFRSMNRVVYVVVMLRSFMTIRKDARLKPDCHDLPHFVGFDAC